jgi:hypothetical protein
MSIFLISDVVIEQTVKLGCSSNESFKDYIKKSIN